MYQTHSKPKQALVALAATAPAQGQPLPKHMVSSFTVMTVLLLMLCTASISLNTGIAGVVMRAIQLMYSMSPGQVIDQVFLVQQTVSLAVDLQDSLLLRKQQHQHIGFGSSRHCQQQCHDAV